MRKFVDKLIFGINALVGLGLLLAYISPYLNPSEFWFLSLFGLFYPFLLFTNLIFIFYWVIRFKRYVFFSVTIIAIGYIHIGKFMQFNEQEEYPPIESVKVISHNLRAFGLNGPEFQTEDGKRIFNFLDEEMFDVYCFQEFFSTNHKEFSPYDSVKKYTDTKYRHVEYLIEFRGSQFGIATLSRYPIIEKGVVPFDRKGTNMCIYSDIDFNGKVVRVYNMHLQSLGFRSKDYAFLKKLNSVEGEAISSGAKNILGRFREAFIKREEQSRVISQHIASCPHPVIVCGDFNDTPLSFTYEEVKGDLSDAFVEKGKGIGSTYNGIFPLLRIDYIFHSAELNNSYFRRIKEDLSDHYPLVAYFTFDEE